MQKQQKGGSRFEVLAGEIEKAKETVPIIHVEGTSAVVVAGKMAQSRHEGGKGGSKRRNVGGSKGTSQGDAMEVEDCAQGSKENQRFKRVEKRTRELSEDTRNEVLMLTMGAGEDEIDRNNLEATTVKPLESEHNIIHPSHVPDGIVNGADGLMDSNGPRDEMMGFVANKEALPIRPQGDLDLDMIPETPL